MLSDTGKHSMEDDKGLAASRRNLYAIALPVLTMNATQANLSAVNGLIIEMTIENPKNLLWMLAIATGYLVLRYFNHAYQYHSQTFESWTSKMLNDPFILNVEHAPHEFVGLATRLAPDGVDWVRLETDNEYDVRRKFNMRLLFNAQFVYEVEHKMDIEYEGLAARRYTVSIWGLLPEHRDDYFRVLGVILKHLFAEFVKHPHLLLLYTPYFVGIAALLSFLLR